MTVNSVSSEAQTPFVLQNSSEYDDAQVSPDGSKYFTVQIDRKRRKSSVKVWDAKTKELLYELVIPPRDTADGKPVNVSTARIKVLKFTADGKYLLGTTIDAFYPNISDGNLIAWNAENGKVAWQTPDTSSHSEKYTGFKFSPDGKILVAVKEVTLSILKGKEELTAEIREVKTGKLLKTLKNPEPGKRKIAFYGDDPDGNLVFSPSAKTLITADKSVAEVWNVETGERRCTFPRIWESATALFSNGLHTDDFQFRDDEKIIAAENDKYLRLWNAENCELIKRIDL